MVLLRNKNGKEIVRLMVAIFSLLFESLPEVQSVPRQFVKLGVAADDNLFFQSLILSSNKIESSCLNVNRFLNHIFCSFFLDGFSNHRTNTSLLSASQITHFLHKETKPTSVASMNSSFGPCGIDMVVVGNTGGLESVLSSWRMHSDDCYYNKPEKQRRR